MAGLVLLTAFVLTELRAEQPITPLRLFNDRSRNAVKDLARSGAPVSSQAQENIIAFRNKPETLGFVGQKWVKREGRGAVRENRGSRLSLV